MQQISALKKNNTFIGVYQQDRNYLLGFSFYDHAHHVRKVLGTEPRVVIKNNSRKNIARDIKVALLDINMPIYNIKDEIWLDNEAQIGFYKQTKAGTEQLYDIHELPYERFMSLPFTNDFGLVIPYEFLGEDDNCIFYKANVIEKFYAKWHALL